MSGAWHDDNCGHRLKMFICVHGDGSTPTLYLPGSHRSRYRFGVLELLRFSGRGDSKSRVGEVALRYSSGDVAVFDTNGLHRGKYEHSACERIVIVAEFINRKKSDVISGRAPCGPGSKPNGEVIFSSAAFEILNTSGLIDQ